MKFCQHCIGPGPTYLAMWRYGQIQLCGPCRYVLATTKKLPEIRLTARGNARSAYKPTLDELDKWGPKR